MYNCAYEAKQIIPGYGNIALKITFVLLLLAEDWDINAGYTIHMAVRWQKGVGGKVTVNAV